jgi:hypothetical protein
MGKMGSFIREIGEFIERVRGNRKRIYGVYRSSKGWG